MKEKIARWYKWNIWTKSMVQDAVGKGHITAEEYEEITGEEYTVHE